MPGARTARLIMIIVALFVILGLMAALVAAPPAAG